MPTEHRGILLHHGAAIVTDASVGTTARGSLIAASGRGRRATRSPPVPSRSRESLMSERTNEPLFSEALVEALFKFSEGVAVVADREGTILSVVGDSDGLFGIASEQLGGKSVFDVVRDEDRERAKRRWAIALESATPLPGAEYWVQFNDRWLCVRVTVSNFLDDPAVGAMVINAYDVTELKHSDSARNALLGSRNALVTVSSEGDLYNALCHVVVGEVAFDLAWIGLVDKSYPLGVHVVAVGGPVGYVEALERLSARSGFRGPAADAMENRAIQVVSDIAMLPGTVIWRDLALAHGYRSLAALPLSGSGVLVIYSKRAQAFGDEVVRLLTAFVDDLSHGREALRSRAERTAQRLRLEASLEATVRAIATAAELRDPYTGGHQRRVGELAAAIAADIGLTADEAKGIVVAASIHDIGKLVVPAEILSKPGRLTAAEFEVVKAHSQAGHDIVAGIDFPWPVGEMILDHHERLNGSGYPRALEGREISLGTRILSVADVVEAMHSHRPYRPALGIDAVLNEIGTGRSSLYDADVVSSCMRLLSSGGFELFDGAPDAGPPRRGSLPPKFERTISSSNARPTTDVEGPSHVRPLIAPDSAG
jgi:PAS domain S-box-containing protein